jgi:inorganic pyrophosphatase
MDEQIFEIQIMQPGRPTGVYRPLTYGTLSLEKVVYPDVPFSFDLAIIPKTLTSQGESLQVILLGSFSNPPQTQITARLLGGIQTDGTAPYLLAAPTVDEKFSSILSIKDLTNVIKSEFDACLKQFSTNDIKWLDTEEIKPWIKSSYLKYRQAKAKNIHAASSYPAWKPTNQQSLQTDYSNAEHYTPAEYTFFQLPYHIQHYVHEYLDDDERILYSIRRPAMRSKRQRTWLGGEKLREGVLILTTQRLIHLVELVPLGESGVRYGFNAQLGMLERLTDISVETLEDEAVLLKTKWEARNGHDFLEWESPLYTRSDIKELAGFLEKFLPKKYNSRAIRRSTLSVDSELPPLSDPSSNAPNLVNIINRRFADALPQLLNDSEKVYTWALWPAWFENKGYCQVLAVTGDRILVIPDPNIESQSILSINQKDVVTLEYAGSILNSYIGINTIETGKAQRIQLNFPYPAEIAFHNCLEAIRRCMAILPLQ